MNDLERNYYKAFVRMWDFGSGQATDFSAGAESLAAIGAAALEMEQAGATQASGGQTTIRKNYRA